MSQSATDRWTPTGANPPPAAALRSPNEMTLLALSAAFSFAVYAVIAAGIILAVIQAPAMIIVLVVYAALGWFISTAVRAAFITHVRGNGLMVGPDQLPRVYAAVQRAAAALGINVPEVYVVQFGALREAMAKTFLGARILVLSSQLVDDNGDGPELDAAVGRELAHFRFRHLRWRFWLFPSMVLPLLYPAWRRATEYTGDLCGLAACGADLEAAQRSMFISAAGGTLGRQVSHPHYHAQVAQSGGFWMTLMHLLSGEPALAWRAARLLKAQPGPGTPSPAPRRSILATILCALVPGMVGQFGSATSAGGGVMTVVVIALLVSFLAPTLSRARELGGRSACVSNIKQLARAVYMYATENRDFLPPSKAVLASQQFLPRKLLICPGNHEEIAYLVEEVRRGGASLPLPRLYDLQQPACTVLFYHSHGSEVVVGFADGHVQTIPQWEFQRLKELSISDMTPRALIVPQERLPEEPAPDKLP